MNADERFYADADGIHDRVRGDLVMTQAEIAQSIKLSATGNKGGTVDVDMEIKVSTLEQRLEERMNDGGA